MRLAIVHDQAADLGGQERAVEALLDHFPGATALAPRFTATNRPDGHRTRWDGRTRLVGSATRRRSFLAPLYARRISSVPLDDADAVVSITQGGWSVAARIPPITPHICYHSGLPQHLYGHSRRYLEDEPPLLRPPLAAALPALRAFDRRLMRRPSRLVANSAFSARELSRVHGRHADIVHPPVRTDFFTPAPAPRRHFLVVARLVGFKRLDLVVDAARGLDAELVVAGGGPRLAELRRGAPPNVRFAGPCDDETLRALYRSAHALICPSVETFGIAIAEAQAAGTPVVAAKAGGVPEAVVDGETAILLERPDPRSIVEAARAIAASPPSPRACRRSAERFSRDRFTAAIEGIVHDELARVRR
jgi:glycosyltransferase involved in cell wall biosynthesis